jgi:two-component system, OmpR family, KDP operon response regulator KdpE
LSLRILLVEDDRELRATLRDALAVEGYSVLTAASLADAQAQLQHHGLAREHGPMNDPGIALVVLDLGLPDGDGQSLLSTLRRGHSAPVIVISARQEGADDYLVKPFSIGELLARMRVALRHRGQIVQAAVTHYAHQGLVIDLPTYSVLLHGKPQHLTPTEFKLLARLVRSAGQVVTHRQLLVDVWGPEFTEHSHYLRLYMGQLRAKLEEDSADPQYLLTETGVGYRLVEPR